MNGGPRGRFPGLLLGSMFGVALAFAPVSAECLERSAHAAEPTVEPPSRLDHGTVPYPPTGIGSASVVLDLVIDRDGSVAEWHLVDGSEPFATAAIDAAKGWRFAPAMRGGRRTQARIRMRIDFAAPAPVPPLPEPTTPPSRPPTPGATPPTAPRATSSAQEVNVYDVRPEPGRQEMTGAEVRQMPGSFGDAFRAIEALPGVTPVISGLPYFLVRGAPPGNTGFFLDGVRVPALFHLGVGAAVVHPGLIDRVDFYQGGYPARFGRYTGGILSGEVLPAPEHAHAEAEVRLLDAGALVSVPIDGGRGDFLASGRYGYHGPLLSLFAPTIGLAYWDYQTRVRWRPTDSDEIGAFAFGSYDSLTQRDDNTHRTSEILGIKFHRVDLRWDRRTGVDGTLRVALTLGYDRSSTGEAQADLESAAAAIQSESVRLRTEWSDHAGGLADVRIGADASVERYNVLLPTIAPDVGSSPTTGIAEPGGASLQTDFDSGVYGELTWRPVPALELRPGLRIDAFTSRSPATPTTEASERALVGVDPRLAVRWQETKILAWLAALGVAHQASNIPLPSPGLQFSQLSRGLQSANQYSAGAELKLPADFTATADLFLHDYTGLADYLESCPTGETTCTFNGRAVGLEVLVRRTLTRSLSGWLSYTLSRAERDAYYLGTWIRRLSEFDRTHVFNLVLAADLGAGWRSGARLVGYSGLPYSTATGSIGPPDARGPPFVRVDVRVEKRWRALGGRLSLVVEWLNALLNKEAFVASCQSFFVGSTIGSSCAPNVIGPITFPSIGLEGEW